MDPFEDGSPLEGWEPAPARGRKGRPQPPEPISPEAAALRAAWIRGVNDYRGRGGDALGRYKPGVRWDGGLEPYGPAGKLRAVQPVWPKLAAAARDAGVTDWGLLVRTLFSTWTSDTGPTPYELTRPHVLDRARNAGRLRRRNIADALRTEEGIFRAAVWAAAQVTPDPERAAAYALNDVGRDLSPLFRYSAAVIRGLPDVAARWRDAAVAQYNTDPAAYAEFWTHLLPDELKPHAALVEA